MYVGNSNYNYNPTNITLAPIVNATLNFATKP